MADEKVLITESTLDEIADAIREKNGESFKYYPREMPSAVRRIPTGTGGGSVVAVFPVLLSGTHIADIVVDGDTFALYAPTPKIYTQGTGIEISQNGVVSISEALRQTIAGKVDSDTFTTAINNLVASVAAKQDLLTEGDGISIHNNVISADVDVSDLSDVNLSSLADGQVLKWNATSQKWENATESGGTTVVANPSGTPTEELSTIQIGEDIYEIVGGGGQSGDAFEETILYENTATPTTGQITLSDSLDNYDMMIITASYSGSDNKINISDICSTAEFMRLYPYVANPTYANANHFMLTTNTLYMRVIMGDANNKIYPFQSDSLKITQVVGLKFKGGGGSGSGTSSEVIPIEAGDGANTRTFTFEKKPKLIHVWFTVPDKWSMTEDIFWGQPWGVYSCTNGNAPYSNGALGSNTFVFDDTNLTMTITGINALGCANNTNGYGYMWLDYGEGGSGTDVEANPSEEPTDTLTTIKIGDTVYDIEGGGGGGSTLPFDVVIDSNDNGINLIYEYDDGQ